MIFSQIMSILRFAVSFSIVVCFSTAPAQSRMETGFLDRSVTIAGSVYHYQVYVPSSYTAAGSWPVILFLHGSGERGDDGLLPTQTGLGAAIRRSPARYPAIVVFPQAPSDSGWVGQPARAAMAALEKTMQEYQTDSDRVYLTGLSMGGNGTWYLAYRCSSKFAAIVPLCGWITPFDEWSRGFETVVPGNDASPFQSVARKLVRMPTWIFHGEEDSAVPVEQSRMAAEAFKTAGGNVQFTELAGTGHNSWDAAYSSTRFTTWLFAQRRKP
jgi:predicted peptidase